MSVGINISNYESYLLSYIDGELNREELAELELFLQQHPQCRQELELLEGVRLVPDEKIVFDNKASLYRTGQTNEVDYESLMLGFIDGELTAAEEQTLQEYLLKHPAAQKELAFLQSAKLTPDISLVFADKASLYRSSKRKPVPLYRRMGWVAAAAVVAGLVIWLLPAPNQPLQAPSIVVDNTQNNVTAPSGIPAPQATPVVPENTPAPVVVPPPPVQPQLAKNDKTAAPRGKKAVAAVPVAVKGPALAVVPKAKPEAPVISQLPPQRNSTDELMEQHLQQPGNAPVAVAKPEINKETVLAASTAIPASSDNDKVVPVATPQRNPGELIASVSGSDSKILDKVTNVAKFFSRKRNK